MENRSGRKEKNKLRAGHIRKGRGKRLRCLLCALAGGLFMGFAGCWGKQLDTLGNVNVTALSSWLAPLGLGAAAAALLDRVFWRLCGGPGPDRGRTGQGENGPRPDGGRTGRTGNGSRPDGGRTGQTGNGPRREDGAGENGPRGCAAAHRGPGLSPSGCFWLTALGLFVCWLPVFLAVYPGFFAYDATDELEQVLTGNYVTRHPLLHVLLLGKTVAGIESLVGSYNAGIAGYVLAQMAAMALLLSWELGCFKKLGAGRALRAAGFCFFAFFPVVPMYVLCTSKDIWYTAGMLAVITLLCRLNGAHRAAALEERGPFAGERTNKASVREEMFGRGCWFGLGAALFVMAVFRNNGFYVFIVMIPLLLALGGKRDGRKMAVTAGLVLLAVLGQSAAVKAVLKPVDTGVQETLTVPIQQLARTWNYSPEVFSEEEREALFEILPQEVLERYTPKLSDLVKIDFNTENYEKDPGRYRRLWLKTGLKAPLTYLNAWLMTSYGFWYPDAAIDVYNGWRSYVKSSYFSFETEEPGVRESHFLWLEEQYRKLSLENIVQQMPVISWLFSPGFLCWVFVLSGLFFASGGGFRQLCAFAPAFLNWLTVLLGPTYLVRYVLVFWFALPLLVVINIQMCYTFKDNA